jgi:hypothetical protein
VLFLKFWFCAGNGTPRNVGLIMQRNVTESWVRCRLYMTCNVSNSLLIKYSNIGCFSANIIRVKIWGGVGGAYSLNGVEY